MTTTTTTPADDAGYVITLSHCVNKLGLMYQLGALSALKQLNVLRRSTRVQFEGSSIVLAVFMSRTGSTKWDEFKETALSFAVDDQWNRAMDLNYWKFKLLPVCVWPREEARYDGLIHALEEKYRNKHGKTPETPIRIKTKHAKRHVTATAERVLWQQVADALFYPSPSPTAELTFNHGKKFEREIEIKIDTGSNNAAACDDTGIVRMCEFPFMSHSPGDEDDFEECMSNDSDLVIVRASLTEQRQLERPIPSDYTCCLEPIKRINSDPWQKILECTGNMPLAVFIAMLKDAKHELMSPLNQKIACLAANLGYINTLCVVASPSYKSSLLHASASSAGQHDISFPFEKVRDPFNMYSAFIKCLRMFPATI